ncbi:MAG: restriction endonuclease subunit S [Lachnospiraceae bacterium]
MLSLFDREWNEFYIGNLFSVKRPRTRSEKQYKFGNVPFVASGNVNNGVIKCCTPNENENLDTGNCITVSPVDGSTFYQGYDFLGRGGAGSSILMLYNSAINKYSGLFIARMIRQTCSKYSYGKMGNQESIKREKIMLPIDQFGAPDYAFMEQYIKEREQQIIQNYIDYIGKIIRNGEALLALNEKEWKEFYLRDVFIIRPGKRLTKSNMQAGLKPFIGASDSNNGVTAFVSNTNISEDSNVLGVNYNGSVVENFYHPYTCIFSDDVKRFALKEHNGNEYIYLFMKTVILQQKNKYAYGYKFNEGRMQKQMILLPVTHDGKPDYDYMERYAKRLFCSLKLKYLQEKLTVDV